MANFKQHLSSVSVFFLSDKITKWPNATTFSDSISSGTLFLLVASDKCDWIVKSKKSVCKLIQK